MLPGKKQVEMVATVYHKQKIKRKQEGKMPKSLKVHRSKSFKFAWLLIDSNWNCEIKTNFEQMLIF